MLALFTGKCVLLAIKLQWESEIRPFTIPKHLKMNCLKIGFGIFQH